MINRQQGFTLLEVMAALAIFSMLSVLAFMIFSQASELHQRSQKEIQQFNQLQRTITILDNDLLQLVARRNRSTDKIMVLGEEAIFTTQSRDPLAPLSEAQPYSLFTGICEIIRSTVLFVLLWMAGRINPPRRCWNMSKLSSGK
ncbi:general secretion pathway protein J [Escherichia coli]|nr:general secretion pathway protein J [Escherichia coli]